MKNNFTYCALILVSLLVLSSCATLLNTKMQTVHVKTDKPSTVLYRGHEFTPNSDSTNFVMQIPRNPTAIEIDVISDSLKEVVLLSPSLSLAYWANLGFYGVGMLVDMNNNKRFEYPKVTHVNFGTFEQNAYPYKPLSHDYHLKKNRIKIAPFTFFAGLRKGISASYERFYNPQLSGQINATLYNNNLSLSSEKNTGFNLGIEGRYFFNKRNPMRTYVGFEIAYLHNKHDANWAFYNPVDTSYAPTEFTFEVNYNEIFIAPRVGIQLVLSELIVLDMYGGFAVGQRRIKQNGVPDDLKMLFFYRPNNEYNRIATGESVATRALFNIKLGIAF